MRIQHFRQRELQFLLFALFCLALPTIAQQDKSLETPEIPKIEISADEQKLLNEEKDLKKRTQLGLKLAEERLAKAENLTQDDKYQNALVELRGYQALIKDVIKFLIQSGNDSKKIRDSVRRLDITLRNHTPRIEVIRRNSPYGYAQIHKDLIEFVRNARSEVLEVLFDDTVIQNQPAVNKNTSQNKSITTDKP